MGVTSPQGKLFPIALLVSLGANLFFAGWILGGHTVNAWHGPPEARNFGERFRAVLSDQGARTMSSAFDDVRRQFEPHFANLRIARDRKSKLLAAEPFDRSAFLAESKAEHTEHASDAAKADEIIANAVAQLSADDRRKLATMRLPPHFGGGRRPPPPPLSP